MVYFYAFILHFKQNLSQSLYILTNIVDNKHSYCYTEKKAKDKKVK